MKDTNKINSKWLRTALIGAGAFMPVLAFAAPDPEQSCSTIRNLTGLFNCGIGIAGYFIAIAILLAFIFFLWGVMTFMMNAEDQTKRTEGRWFMIWGTVALFVMVSVWGFVQILQNTFGVGGKPQFNQSYLPTTRPNANGSCPYGVLDNNNCVPQP